MANYIVRNINQVTKRMNEEIAEMEKQLGRKVEFSEYAAMALDYIHKKGLESGAISLEDQHLIGAILGYMFHEAYRDTRKLDKPNENGLMYNPREKKLTDPLDAEFVQEVLDGKVPQSNTLFVRDGVVIMDIANTDFVHLSPYWKKENYMAGKTAARSIITCWGGLSHENPEVQKYVTIAVANGIHEAWISRENVYYDEYEGKVYTNEELDTAYIYLVDDEKAKDLEHVQMASRVIGQLVGEISKAKGTGSGEKSTDEPDENQPQ